MSIENNIIELGKRAKSASLNMKVCSSDQKNLALKKLTKNLDKNRNNILEANKIDLENGEKKFLAKPLINRLTLTEKSIDGLITSIEDIIKIPDPIGITLEEWERPNGLQFRKISTPLGVLGVIYESRPNVTVDASCLSIKSGNCIILRGGSDSFHSSKELVNNITNAFTEAGLPEHCVQMINTPEREAVDHLLSMRDYVDVIIPRGGKGLIEKINSVSKIPVIKHLDGICHVYVDKDADLSIAEKVVFNSKMRRPEICGAAETLLIDEKIKDEAMKILQPLKEENCEIRGDEYIQSLDSDFKTASEEDWSLEYLDKILSVKIVSGVDEAVKHINDYSSGHTESIITESEKTFEKFYNKIDSAIILKNASTQFADGGEFGFGAEIGISTDKIHVRGPVGTKHLTTFKYVVNGNGQERP
jgi:glutamate-5-semialdehyde dehydrogenase